LNQFQELQALEAEKPKKKEHTMLVFLSAHFESFVVVLVLVCCCFSWLVVSHSSSCN
jgi:hypothetical protein